jgi:L-threonylcarbamoyladenylate synthase
MIVDGGVSSNEVPTTIVDLTRDDGWQVIREGAILTHQIALALQD